MAEVAYSVYGVMALGAVGVYLASPGHGRGLAWAGALVGLAGLAALFVAMARRFGAVVGIDALFYVFAAVAVMAGARVVTCPKPVYAALYLVLLVLAGAGLLVLADAEFLAAALVIVYAGAIVVTYVFVLMLARQSGMAEYDARSRDPGIATVAGFVLTASICSMIAGQPMPAEPAAMPSVTSNTMAVGADLLSTYAVAVELAGVLLLVAIVGAIFITRSRVDGTGEAEERERL